MNRTSTALALPLAPRLSLLLALAGPACAGEGAPEGAGGASGAKTTASAQQAATAAKPAPPSKPAADKEIVFDPANPPPGWLKCHNNHCHHADGRVASYAMVAKEMGATRILGGQALPPAPPAPPDVAAPPADAQRTSSGLASKVLREGSASARPTADSVVTVHYTGWTTDGKSFDSSISRGQPASFPLRRVIPGWTEGLQLMNVGEERRFWIPEELAYKGRPGKPQGMLVFDVELLDIR